MTIYRTPLKGDVRQPDGTSIPKGKPRPVHDGTSSKPVQQAPRPTPRPPLQKPRNR